GVDGPVRGAGDTAAAGLVGDDVVQGADHPVEAVGPALGVVLLGQVGVARVVEQLHGLLLAVGVEVPAQQHVLDIQLRARSSAQSIRASACCRREVRALPWTGSSGRSASASSGEPFDLKCLTAKKNSSPSWLSAPSTTGTNT